MQEADQEVGAGGQDKFLLPEAGYAGQQMVSWNRATKTGRAVSSVMWSSVMWSSVMWSSVMWSSVMWSSVMWSSVMWSSVMWSGVIILNAPCFIGFQTVKRN